MSILWSLVTLHRREKESQLCERRERREERGGRREDGGGRREGVGHHTVSEHTVEPGYSTQERKRRK